MPSDPLAYSRSAAKQGTHSESKLTSVLFAKNRAAKEQPEQRLERGTGRRRRNQSSDALHDDNLWLPNALVKAAAKHLTESTCPPSPGMQSLQHRRESAGHSS
jgi:hypothetical protein